MSASKGTYEVGYGRTPTHTRFQKGQSGNPGGRRKGQPTAQELILREANRLVKVKNGDKTEMITKHEVIVRRLLAASMQGELGATRLVLAVMASAPVGGADIEDQDESALQSLPAKPDEDMVRRMLARFSHLRNDEAAP